MGGRGMPSPVVLVVDDEQSLHEIVAARLSDFELLHAYNGWQALDLLKAHKVDVVLLDLDIPPPNGFGVLDELRLRRYRVSVLVLTANHSPDVCVAAARRGARDVLDKSTVTYLHLADSVLAAADDLDRLSPPGLAPAFGIGTDGRAIGVTSKTIRKVIREDSEDP
jgi:DNA-binding NtrC family response regulator